MAKEDFCFTYYDGDAARDMQHMDRLCRGAYNDLVIMQRKVGRLTIKHIKMVLGSDYERCWPSLEVVLKNENEKFWIEWVENSVEKSKKNAEKNRKKVQEYWESEDGQKRKKTPKSFQNDTTEQKIDSDVIPLGNGNGNGNGNNEKEGMGEKPISGTFIGNMIDGWKKVYPKTFIDKSDTASLFEIARKIHQWQEMPERVLDNQEAILLRWGEIITHCQADGHLHKYSIAQVNKHFSSVIQSFKSNGTEKNRPESTTGNQKSASTSKYQPKGTGGY